MKNFTFTQKQTWGATLAIGLLTATTLWFAVWHFEPKSATTDSLPTYLQSSAEMMMCATAKPITRWNRLTPLQVDNLNDNDSTTNVTGFHTGFCNGMNPILVDISATGAYHAGNPNNINQRFTNRWGLTSFNNSREAGGNSGNRFCFTFSEPVAFEVNSREHRFFHDSEHIIVTALDNANLPLNLAGNLQGTAGPTMTGNGTAQVRFDGNGLVETGAWWEASSNGNLAKTVCIEYFKAGPGQGFYGREPFTLSICDQTRCLFDDPFAQGDPDNPAPMAAISDSLTLSMTTECIAPAASGVPGNVDLTFRLTMENHGKGPLTDLQIEDDLADHVPVAAFIAVVDRQFVPLPNSTPTPPTFNPAFTGIGSIRIFNGNDGSLAPGQAVAVDLTVEFDPNQLLPYQSITNQAFGFGKDIALQYASAASDAPAGQPGNEIPGVVDGLFLRIPSLNVAKFVADYLNAPTCDAAGNVSTSLRFLVENTGNVNLDLLSLSENLSTQLGGSFLGIDAAPTLTASTATTNPTLNASYTGIAPNDNIFNGTSGLLAPGQMLEITMQLRLDPNNPLAANPLQNQAIATGRGVTLANVPYPGCNSGYLVASDNSDSGTVPESYNPTAVGASPNSHNDPLPLQLPNIGAAKSVVSFAPAASQTPGNLDVRFRMELKNTGNVNLSNLQVSDDLATQLGAAYIGIVSPPAIVLSTAAVNPSFGSFPNNIFNGTTGQLNPNQTISVEFVAELNPDAPGLTYPLENQANASGTGAGPMGPNLQVSALSDGGTDPESTNSGAPGDTGCSNDALALNLPALRIAKYFAGIDCATSGTPGNFDITTEILVQNVGSVPLTNLSLLENLGAATNFGSAYIGMTQAPHIVAVGAKGTATNATSSPAVSPSFNGNGNLLDGTSGLLNPGEIFVLQFRFELNSDAPGAPAVLKNQVTASATGVGPNNSSMTVTDLSDDGDTPQSTNPSFLGNSGGTDDPTLLSNCWNQLGNGIACNDLMQVSLNQLCEIWLTPDMVLEGEPFNCINPNTMPLGTYFQVLMVTDAWGTPVPDLNPATPNTHEISGSFIGQTLTVKIQDKVFKNSCWGNIFLEDKLAPVFTCPSAPVQIFCTANLASVPPPTAADNCDPNPVITLLGQQTIDNNICDDGIYTVRRTFSATDSHGNTTAVNCVQNINVVRPAVDFPDDITWGCTQFATHPSILNATKLHPAIIDTDPVEPGIDVSLSLSDSILNLTGSGIVNISVSTVCGYNVLHSDQPLSICGSSFKILRTWTVIDWCTGDIVTTGVGGEDNVQVVKVMDTVKPNITRAPFNVSVNVPSVHPAPCKSTGLLLPPTTTDNCNAVTVQIITSVGEAIYVNGLNGNNGGYIPAQGLSIGTHLVTYIATDACGNSRTINVPVTVVDDTSPTNVCIGFTEVDLPSGQNPTATVLANVFNTGSFDNCCLHHFEARRMDESCNDGHDDTVFGPSVVFCCNDVGTGPIMVVVRAFDCFGNYNDCMVNVTVNDKQPPVLITCPFNMRISCDNYANNLELQLDSIGNNSTAKSQFMDANFGQPVFADNCTGLLINRTFTQNISQCKEGTIVRQWTATDAQGQTSLPCTQTVFIDHVSDFVVTFPKDTTVNCGQAVPDFGEPTIFNETCEMIAVSHADTIYPVVQGACYKIERTWNVINWCVVGVNVDNEVTEVPENQLLGLPFPQCDLDGDGDCDNRTFQDSWTALQHPSAMNANVTTGPDSDLDSDPWDGYITYKQTIKIIDTVDPVFVSCGVPDVCINDSLTCTATFTIPTPVVEDCSSQMTITATTTNLPNGFGPFSAPPGTYVTTFTASDGCNNFTLCTDTFEIMDCKAPLISCKTGFIAVIVDTLPPSVTVNAEELDNGSGDNCTVISAISYSSDPADSLRTFFCDDVGVDSVEIWFTDMAGNQDFCKTTIEIQASTNECPEDTLVVNLGGQIMTENDISLGGVTVNVSGLSGNISTSAAGSFYIQNIPVGQDVTIVPNKDTNPLTGVTTYDLVLLSKHILGIEALDSPYKLIAADANNSQTITTFDIVEIRKLILHINTDFPSNTAWRFVDRGYDFPVPTNPWLEDFPEIISINNIPTSVVDADFVAVKIGDVNSSYNFAGNAIEFEERSERTLVFTSQNQVLRAGETVSIRFQSPDFKPAGYQFTLDFDTEKLAFEEVGEGVANASNFGLTELPEGAILASWNEHGERPEDLPEFTLKFSVKQDVKLSDAIWLSDRFTHTEGYDHLGGLLKINLQFIDNESVAGFELYQNKPNSFSKETLIGFRLPADGPAQLTILDNSGRVVKTIHQDCSQGYNEFLIDRTELGQREGIFYYRLTAGTATATRMMMLTN